MQNYSVLRTARSRSIASKNALKLPLPKLREPRRWIVSKENVGRLDLFHACRRPHVVDDAVGPAETGEGDDLFVINARVLVAGLVREGDMALAREGAALEVVWHN